MDFAPGAQSKLSTDLKKFPELVLRPSRGQAFQAEGRTSAKGLSVPGFEGGCDHDWGCRAGEEPREVARPGRGHGRTWL